jgi:hypothetical protein
MANMDGAANPFAGIPPEVLLAYMTMAGNAAGGAPGGGAMDMAGMMQKAMAAVPGLQQAKKPANSKGGKGKGGNHFAMPHTGDRQTDMMVDMIQKSSTGGGEKRSGSDDKAAVDPRKYKTRMCRNFEETGHCPYEHTCCFAHGDEELRSVTDNHKLLASIGYFSNVILLAMTNGQKPALPPHCLYQQPTMFKTPETADQLKQCSSTLPAGVHFPFQEPLPSAFKGMKGDKKLRSGDGATEKKRRRGRGRRGKKDGNNSGDDDDANGVGEDVGA